MGESSDTPKYNGALFLKTDITGQLIHHPAFIGSADLSVSNLTNL
jgi:hypothetical protein